MSSVAPAPSKLGIAAPTRKRLGSRFTGRASPTRIASSFAGEGCPPGESQLGSLPAQSHRVTGAPRRSPGPALLKLRPLASYGEKGPDASWSGDTSPFGGPSISRITTATRSPLRDARFASSALRFGTARWRGADGRPGCAGCARGRTSSAVLTVSRGTSFSRIHGDSRASRFAGGPEPRLEYGGSSSSLPGHSCLRSLRMASSPACRVASAWRIMLS